MTYRIRRIYILIPKFEEPIPNQATHCTILREKLYYSIKVMKVIEKTRKTQLFVRQFL